MDTLVFHFLRYAAAARDIREGNTAPGPLPVIYHQCLLVFVQRYRNDREWPHPIFPHRLLTFILPPPVTEDQREALLDLLLNHGHHKIAPEIRRELLAGRGRGVPAEQPDLAFDGDDTMLID